MFTLFDLFRLIGAWAGVWYAASFAYRASGWPAAVVAVPLGYAAGRFVGHLPFVAALAFLRHHLQRAGNDDLKARLQAEYYLSHLLIAELVSRGEPAEQFREYVAGLLRSEDPDRPRFGYRCASIWFPDLVAGSPESREAAERDAGQ